MKLVLSTLILLAGTGLALRHEPSTDTLDHGVRAMTAQPKLKTCLWFQSQAEQAVRFYTSIFRDSKVLSEMRWGEGGFGPPGSIIAMDFEIAGTRVMALNGAQGLAFNDTMSLVVECDTQAEVDELWEKLCAGGQPGQCGWLKDKFGVSWQIVPKELPALLGEKDPARRKRVLDAMLGMQKLDVAKLRQARDDR